LDKIPDFENRKSSLISDSIQIRNKTEQSLVYKGQIESLLKGIDTFNYLESIKKIMSSDEFGHKENASNVSQEWFKKSFSNKRIGIRLCMLGLPFRDQNPFRTPNCPSTVTLAEAFFLVRLHTTALALYQVVPPGADVLILSDGLLYSEIFGVEKSDASSYLNNVRALRSQLNLSGTISIVDLKEAIKLADNGRGVFDSVNSFINKALSKYLLLSHRQQDAEALESLITGIKWNMNSRSFTREYSEIGHWLSSNSKTYKKDILLDWRSLFLKAIDYASLNLTLKWLDVVNQMFPTSVRATVHPKKDQLAIPKLGSVLAWNGVAISNSDSLQVMPLYEAISRGYQLREVHCDNEIIYYERY